MEDLEALVVGLTPHPFYGPLSCPRLLVRVFSPSPSSSSDSPTAFGGILFGYDTGTIGGIIAMEDWLKTFGSYDSSIGYYLPTNNSSLVVRIYF